MRFPLLALFVSVGLATPVVAQSVSQGPPSWGRGTGLAVSPGVSLANEHVNMTLGGAALWELTAHFAIEGTGRGMDCGVQADAYAGELSALIGLGGTRDTAVPYLVLGVGLHRRTFEVHDTTALDDVPGFYRRRLGAPGGVLGVRRSFTESHTGRRRRRRLRAVAYGGAAPRRPGAVARQWRAPPRGDDRHVEPRLSLRAQAGHAGAPLTSAASVRCQSVGPGGMP